MDAFAALIVENDYKLLKSPSSLSPKVSDAPIELRQVNDGSALTAFQQIFPLPIWNFLLNLINTRIRIKNIGRKKHNRLRELSVDELVRWYGILMTIENTYGNDSTNIRDHFADVSAYFEKKGIMPFGLGREYFCFVLNSLTFEPEDIETLCQHLAKSSSSQIIRVSTCAVDESLIAYKPSPEKKKRAEAEGEPISTVFIQRKPHKDGLLLYLACSYTNLSPTSPKVPYIIAFYPHLREADQGDAFATLVQQVNTLLPNQEIHWVADAWFDSGKNFQSVPEQHTYTISLSSARSGKITEPLSAQLAPGKWIATEVSESVHVASARLEALPTEVSCAKTVRTNNWVTKNTSIENSESQVGQEPGPIVSHFVCQ